MATYRLRRTVHVNAPVDAVFDYLKNPANMWTAFPKCKTSDVHLTPDGVGSSDHFSVRYWGVAIETGTHEVVEAVPDQKLAVRTHPYGAGNGPLWTWTFRPEDGGTRLDLDMADEGPKAVLVINRLFEKTMDETYTRWLNAIKANVEALVGAAG